MSGGLHPPYLLLGSEQWLGGASRRKIIGVVKMDYDQTRIEDAVLALLAAFSFDEGRAWKGFDFDVMDSLHSQRFISDPKSKSKSVWLTPEGIERGREIAERLFSGSSAGTV
jgi:hypothetical protein